MTASELLPALEAFRNEPYRDFRIVEHRRAMDAALASGRAECGREYDLRIDGKTAKGSGTFTSLNPSDAKHVIGVHQKATKEQAAESVEAAHRFFPEWS